MKLKTRATTTEERIKEMEEKVNKAFHGILDLVNPEDRSKAIDFWVQGTMNSKWIGWEKGYDTGNGN